jgi:hypothetical protein
VDNKPGVFLEIRIAWQQVIISGLGEKAGVKPCPEKTRAHPVDDELDR